MTFMVVLVVTVLVEVMVGMDLVSARNLNVGHDQNWDFK